MLAKIGPLHLRDRISSREVSRRAGLSRNTVRSWLRRPEVAEPKCPPRKPARKLDGRTEVLRVWLRSDSHRARRERGTAMALYGAMLAQGYAGGYGRVLGEGHRREEPPGSAAPHLARSHRGAPGKPG